MTRKRDRVVPTGVTKVIPQEQHLLVIVAQAGLHFAHNQLDGGAPLGSETVDPARQIGHLGVARHGEYHGGGLRL